MSTEQPASSSSGKVILVIALVGLVLLLILGACAGGVYFLVRGFTQAMSTMMQQVQEMQANAEQSQLVAQNFLDDVAAGRLKEAYEGTTQAYQKRQKFEEFQAFVDKNPPLKKSTVQLFANAPQSPGMTVFSYQATVNGPSGPLSCTLQVLKEGNQWKVERFTIP